MKKFQLILFILTFLIMPARAQLYQYLDTQTGLSSRRVLSVKKDNKGYMWFLTHEGIDKYNGKQYVHYPLSVEGKNINFFPNLNTLQIDTAGVIWEIGKNGYIFKYNALQDQYDLVCNFAEQDKSNRGLPLTATYLDTKNNIWLCTKNKQHLFTTADEKLIQLSSSIQEEITYIAEGDNDHYFLATNHNVYCVKLENNQLEIQKHPKLEKFHIVNYLFFHQETQTLVIGTLLDGIYLYNIHSRQLIEIDNELLKDVNVNTIIANKGTINEVLIATNGAGIYKLNLFNYRLTPYLNADHNHAHKMNGNIVNDMYIDNDGKLWMAVYPIGITIYSDQFPDYKWIQHSYDNSNSLINNQVNYIIEDTEGDIWYATNNGISCYNTQTGQWRSVLSTYQHDTSNQNHVFTSLCEVIPGQILAGGYMSGMYLIKKKDMSLQYYYPRSKDWSNIRPDKYIRCIYKDDDDMIWSGGYYNLKCYNPHTKNTDHYDMDFPVSYITAKDKDNLWIGSINGLYQFTKSTKTLKPLNLSSEMGCINTIYQDEEKITYIGTHGSGLWIYNNTTEKVVHYHADNSALISNNIYCILPRLGEDLILSTEQGLTRFKVKEKIFFNWTQERGLRSANFNPAAGIHTRSGSFIFGSGKGAIELADTITLPHRYQSKMVFYDFSILYQKVFPGAANSPLQKDIDDTERITLSHDQNIFSLHVSSINYDNPSSVMYTWKLEGFYDEWATPTNDNLIRYTNIGPGHYKLRVRATLVDDFHILEERTIYITVTPPFWRTFGAGVIYLILIVLIGSSILRYIWLRKDRNNSKEKIRFFINTAHDIRTPLTLIKAPLGEILKKETLSEQGKMNINLAIQNTDNLSDLATNLINFEKEDLYTPAVYVARYELNSYIKTYLEQFYLYAEKKQIQIKFESSFDVQEVWLDKNKMDSIIRNLMTNALKYTQKEGTITVFTHKDKKHWFLTITDTGIGIPANDQKRLFKQLFRGYNATNLQITGSGIGMLLTYRLIKNHMGKVSVWSTEDVGTTFKLSFPIKSRKYNYRIFHKNESVDPLPVLEENKEGKLAEKSLPRRQANEQAPYILLVEDNVELSTFLKQTLSEEYRIGEAGNGQQALERVSEKQPDLILSDVMMPIMNGDVMCSILKNNMETSHIPVILLTALNDKESIIRGLETKADKYIVKPFDLAVLKANIANVLANKELSRKRFSSFNFHTAEEMIDEQPGIDLDQEFLIKVTEKIKQNINKDLNVDILCSSLNMSRSSFYNKIKALTNCSPSDYIRKVRMNEAATLLRSKRYTVSEISDMLGFGDPKYFTDTFKKYHGVPPSTYMKQN